MTAARERRVRVEDRLFLAGKGRYVGDFELSGQAFGAVVRSPHAHARILGLDKSRAAAAPGVLCVLTGEEAAGEGLGGIPPLFMPEESGGPAGFRTERPLLATGKVRFVGEAVAFVVARSIDEARDAAEEVEVAYEALPCAVTPADAAAPGAPRVHEDCAGNVCFRARFGDPGATRRPFAQAAHVVRLQLASNRVSANPIEPRSAIGSYDEAAGSYLLYTASQNPHGVRDVLAKSVFREPKERFRVVSPDVGGGFGMKADAYPEDALVLWAAKRCGRPVKWIATRSESLLADNHGRDQQVDAEMALDAGGRILALRVRALHALGAYVVSAGVAPPMMSLRFLPSVYDVRAVDLASDAVFTHTAPLGVYRGAGRPEAIFVVERLLDRAARLTGRDPVELRRLNLVSPAALPYRSATGCSYDSGDFPRMLERCLELADWQGFAARKETSVRRGLLRGRAIAPYIEQSGVFDERMELRFDAEARVTIVAGTHSHGQGHASVFTRMLAERLGIRGEDIDYVQGDTARVPLGRGTYAARSSMLGGCALAAAADAAIAKARAMAAQLLEAAEADIEFQDGRFRIAGTRRAIGFRDVVKGFHRGELPPRFAKPDSCGTWSSDPPNHPDGCHACEVEVDPDTGAVRVARYTAVDDVGRALDPVICEGQVHGGLAQGIGQALLEEIVYERESGQLTTGSFADYCLPRADDLPAFDTALEEIPCRTNPLGVKGVGESGAIGPPAAVVNALLDALAAAGVEGIDMPATPQRVWRALRAARRNGAPCNNPAPRHERTQPE